MSAPAKWDTRPRVHIRWMIRRDMPEVLQIESEGGCLGWQEKDLLDCLRVRNVIGMVAEWGDTVIGFMVYEMHKHRLHVLNMVVHPAYRRQGVGTQLVEKLLRKLDMHRRREITVNVPDWELGGQLLFRKHRFLAVHVLHAEYVRGESFDDAYVMKFDLPDEAP